MKYPASIFKAFSKQTIACLCLFRNKQRLPKLLCGSAILLSNSIDLLKQFSAFVKKPFDSKEWDYQTWIDQVVQAESRIVHKKQDEKKKKAKLRLKRKK